MDWLLFLCIICMRLMGVCIILVHSYISLYTIYMSMLFNIHIEREISNERNKTGVHNTIRNLSEKSPQIWVLYTRTSILQENIQSNLLSTIYYNVYSSYIYIYTCKSSECFYLPIYFCFARLVYNIIEFKSGKISLRYRYGLV